jgi:hypothetical protein
MKFLIFYKGALAATSTTFIPSTSTQLPVEAIWEDQNDDFARLSSFIEEPRIRDDRELDFITELKITFESIINDKEFGPVIVRRVKPRLPSGDLEGLLDAVDEDFDESGTITKVNCEDCNIPISTSTAIPTSTVSHA